MPAPDVSPRSAWRRGLLAAAAAALLVVGGAAWFGLGRHAAVPAPAERLYCGLPAAASAAPHPGMAWVPAGSFDFGDSVYPEEQPVVRTRVAGFWMDRTEVTNDEFAKFVQATGYVTVAEREVDSQRHPGLPAEMRRPGAVVFVMPVDVNDNGSNGWRYVPGANWRHPGGPATRIDGRGSFPVVTVTYEDATAYARWKGRALPSEAQWEWAARAGRSGAMPAHDQPLDANTWQGLFPVVNSGEDGFKGLAPVGCYPPNAWGLFDMIGNVWELTSDAYQPSHAEAAPKSPSPQSSPQRGEGVIGAAMRPLANGQRVIKGGSFLCAPNYCMRYRAGARQPQDDDLGASHLGFRTVLNAPGP